MVQIKEISLLILNEKIVLVHDKEPKLYLINSTRNKARDIPLAIKYLWEWRAEAWSSLNGWEAYFPDTVAVCETKYGLGLIVGHQLLNSADVFVEFLAASVREQNVYLNKTLISEGSFFFLCNTNMIVSLYRNIWYFQNHFQSDKIARVK